MSAHIGIVACSAEGASLCYRTLCVEGTQYLGEHAHPEVSLHSHSLADYMQCIYRDDWPGVGKLMLSSANKLAAIGADFLICPDNTIHQVFDLVRPRSPLPWLHIAEVVAEEAVRLGFRFEGVFFNHQVFKGRNRDTAWFSILDEEWPGVRAAFATWLAADNFGADGWELVQVVPGPDGQGLVAYLKRPTGPGADR